MKAVNLFLDWCRSVGRQPVRLIAKALNNLSRGRISPNFITLTSLLAHLPIAWLIASQNHLAAAILLVIFGLFDALDGEIARLQNKASDAGMLLDASTDRFKEVLLYSGTAFSLVASGQAYYAVWAVAACGAALCVSYVKAKGETAVTSGGLTANEINRLFQDGLMRFEIRMTALVIGLIFNQLALVVVILAILSALTAVSRLFRITAKL